jgi:hypothetical protein
MYETYIGEKKSLVFPAMCDAYLLLEHRQGRDGSCSVAGYENQTACEAAGGTWTSTNTEVEPYGIWDINKNIIIQALVTPYDVNGFGWDLNSASTLGNYGVDANYQTKKSIPQTLTGGGATNEAASQSNRCLSKAHRLATASGNDGYIMSLFYNESIELYLQNTTLTNHNQPAEYQVCLKVLSDPLDASTAETIRTDPIITSRNLHHGKSVEGTITNQRYNTNNDTIQYDRVADTIHAGNPITTGSATFDLAGADNRVLCYAEQELYANTSGQTFTLIGTVQSVISGTVTLKANAAVAVAAGGIIYQITKREAPYLLNYYHIAASFSKITGQMNIYVNGVLAANDRHTGYPHTGNYGKFYMYPANCKIGQNDTAVTTTVSGTDTKLYSQFFGEIHEFAITEGEMTEVFNTDTLMPQHRNLLLYYRFEERDK